VIHICEKVAYTARDQDGALQDSFHHFMTAGEQGFTAVRLQFLRMLPKFRKMAIRCLGLVGTIGR